MSMTNGTTPTKQNQQQHQQQHQHQQQSSATTTTPSAPIPIPSANNANTSKNNISALNDNDVNASNSPPTSISTTHAATASSTDTLTNSTTPTTSTATTTTTTTTPNQAKEPTEAQANPIDTIQSILNSLLSLRAQPPGTLAHISEEEIRTICQKVKPILLSQPMLLELEAPLKICGDVHGQYTDLLRLFEYGGFPPQSNYLFLGDYVDRGKQSLEVICLQLCYKIKYPENFFLLRGNHESAGINRIYGFYDECKRRYSIKLWKVFSDVFNCLPVSALVEEKILCMHGGLSPELTELQQIAKIKRPTDVPDIGIMCDLLWSDPDTGVTGYADNDRGVSFTFGADVVENFLATHDLDLIVRAHQVVEDGYEFFAGRRLVTLFSAPNYCGEFDNAGGIISVDENLMCSFQILKPSTRSTRAQARRMSLSERVDPNLIPSASASGGDVAGPALSNKF